MDSSVVVGGITIGHEQPFRVTFVAAKSLLALGNDQVVFCERGSRTFDPAMRNSLDIASIPEMRFFASRRRKCRCSCPIERQITHPMPRFVAAGPVKDRERLRRVERRLRELLHDARGRVLVAAEAVELLVVDRQRRSPEAMVSTGSTRSRPARTRVRCRKVSSGRPSRAVPRLPALNRSHRGAGVGVGFGLAAP